MNRSSKGSSFFSGALGLLRGKPSPSTMRTASKSGARILAKKRGESGPAVALPFRAAEIVCGRTACESARSLSGVRFLAGEVPRLPLQDCTSPNCRCTYSRHDDRRNLSEERRAQFSMKTKLYSDIPGNEERRRKYGRREGEISGRAEYYEFKNWDI